MMHPNEENREDKMSIFLASIHLHPQKVATEIVMPQDVKSVESFKKSGKVRRLMINLRTFC
jgi:hypothetical protein